MNRYRIQREDDTIFSDDGYATEFKQVNEKYQKLLAIIPHWIWEVDHNLRIVHSNEPENKIIDYQSDEIIGSCIKDILFSAEFNGVDFESLLYKLRCGKAEKIYFEHSIRHFDQSIRHLKTTIVSNRDSSGEIIGYQGITCDHTSQIKAEADKRAIYNGAIDSIAVIHEQRDNYTSDHQRNVARIAVAIAQELGFDDDRIEGLRVAAVLHDIGKISIPAEILNSPAKLNEIEREIVKMHPKLGANIIRHIPFPWDVARFVIQHHERIDGSGYPKGLKGDEISLEAKIIGAADTMDSIVNHRPYKPAQDIEKALAIIQKERSVKLDSQVVDAILLLYRRGFFDFYIEKK